MELDAQFFMVAIPAVLFAGISKGGFGSGAAFAAASILAVALEPGQALGIMLPLLMLMDVANLRPYWKKWSAPDAKLLILGALQGVALGAWLYTIADADVFRLLIGVISVGFVAWQMGLKLGLIRAARAELPLWAGALAGATADVTVLGFQAADPGRYGRLVTGPSGLERIVEWKDATEAERAIRLCNSGVVAAEAGLLADLVAGLSNDNAAGEYYLPDVVAAARARGLSAEVALCDEAGLEPARVAVGWVLAQPAVTAPILGASRADQLDDVLPAFEEPLPEDLVTALDEVTRTATLEWEP